MNGAGSPRGWRSWRLPGDVGAFVLAACVGVAIVALVTFAAGLARILPSLLEPDVPLGAARPFVFGLAALSLEVGALVGWPLGWAEIAVRSRERGEARARMALGESPAGRLVRLMPATLVLALLTAVGSLAWGRDARSPGRVARALIEAGRKGCTRFAATRDATAGEVVAVPLVRATWLCRGGGRPMLVAEGAGGAPIDFAARELVVADDLTTFDADEAQILVPSGSSEGRPTRVTVGHARVTGIAPFSAPSSVSPIARALAIVASAIVAASLATASALRGESSVRAGAWGVAIVGPAATLAALRACEQARVSGWRLIVLPLAAAAATWGVRAVARAVRRAMEARSSGA